MENRQGEYFLTTKEFSQYRDGKDTTELFSEKEISITQQQWDDFVYEINKNCFWTMPIVKENHCLDGTSHILEGNLGENNCTESTYHIVSRSCRREPQFNILCEQFYKFELLNYRNIYDYYEGGDGTYEFENDSLSIRMSYDEFAYGDTLVAEYGDDLFVNIYLKVNNFVLFDSVFAAEHVDVEKIGNSKKYDPEKKHRYTTLYKFSDVDKSIEVAMVDEYSGVIGLKVRFKDSKLAPIDVVLKE